MPIVKLVSVVHDGSKRIAEKATSNLIEYNYDVKKRPPAGVVNLLDYADNKNKNFDNEKFISTINGLSKNKNVAKKQLMMTRANRLWEKNRHDPKPKKNSRFLYHFVVSFNKYDTEKFSWEQLHKFSEQIAKEICGSEYQSYLSSHLPSSDESNDYFHTHIVINAYSKKYKGNKLHIPEGYVEKLISKTNKLANVFGYSEVSEPEMINSMKKDKSWYEHKKYKNNDSWKEELKKDLYYVRNNSKDFYDYIEKVEKLGYKVRYKNSNTGKEYKTISYSPRKDQAEAKAVRGKTLGYEFTKLGLQEYFSLSFEERKEYEKKKIKDELSKIKNEEEKMKTLNNKIFNKIMYAGELRKIKKYDKNKNVKTKLEIDLELEANYLREKEIESSDYIKDLYHTLNFVSMLKIKSYEELNEKIKEKDELFKKLFNERNELNKTLDEYNLYLEYFDFAKQEGKLKYAESRSTITLEELKTEKELLEKKIITLNKKIDNLKVYSKDLLKSKKFYDSKETLHEHKAAQKSWIEREEKKVAKTNVKKEILDKELMNRG